MQTVLVFFTDRLQKKIRSDSLVSRSFCTKLMRKCNWELVLTSFQIKERKTNFELFLPLYEEVINELQKFRISKFLASYRTPARNLGLVELRPQAGFAGVIHQWKRALYAGMFALVGMTIAALPKCRH